MTAARAASQQRGATLVELMIAALLGMLVAAGMVTVFISTSNSNRAQTQLARLQEEGRFAMTRLSSDLRMANGQYCSNTGGVASASGSGPYLDHLLAPKIYAKALIPATAGAAGGALADVTTTWGASSGAVGYPQSPRSAYSMPSFLFMRGYDCSLSTCLPVDPVVIGLPPAGTAVGDRVKGSSVITVRYVEPSSGWSIGGVGGTTLVTGAGFGEISTITLNPLTGEPPKSNFSDADLAMLADCSGAQIFAVSYAPSSGTLSVADADNFPGSRPVSPGVGRALKVFDVNRDFQTVTYYLKLVSINGNDRPPLTGALIRRVNGGLGADGTPRRSGASEDIMVQGIERLDFRYGVEDVNGRTSFFSAQQVDTSTNCPPSEMDAITTAGCLWRGVKSIEASILMDGQVPLESMGASEITYAYAADGIRSPVPPSAHRVKPSDQGFPDKLLRREFTTLVALRNYNP